MKKTYSKLIIFTVIMILLQTCISRIFPYKIPYEVTNILTSQQQKRDIVYFGDSSVMWFSKYDTNTTSIATMLDVILGKNHSVGEVSHNSYHAGVFDAYTKFMQEHNYYPSYIIIPINLRSFSTEWNLSPQYQFTDEMFYLQFSHSPLYPFLSFLINSTIPDVNRIYDTLYALAPVYDGDHIIANGTSYTRQMKSPLSFNTRIKTNIQMDYFGKISATHRRLEELVLIAKRYNHTSTKVIFYITPIDYQTGEHYFGKHFDQLVNTHIATIRSILEKQGTIVMDLSRLQTSHNFIWKEDGYMNEHLNQYGRHKVAEVFAKYIDPALTDTQLAATVSSKLIGKK